MCLEYPHGAPLTSAPQIGWGCAAKNIARASFWMAFLADCQLSRAAKISPFVRAPKMAPRASPRWRAAHRLEQNTRPDAAKSDGCRVTGIAQCSQARVTRTLRYSCAHCRVQKKYVRPCLRAC